MITRSQFSFLVGCLFYLIGTFTILADAQAQQLSNESSIEAIQQEVKYHLRKRDLKDSSLWVKGHPPPKLGEKLKSIPVQFKGRLQPFDTFARNSLQFIYGRDAYNFISAVDVLVSWMLIPDSWNHTALIKVEKANVKQTLQLDVKRHLFSPLELLSNSIFLRELEELQSRVSREEDLNSYFKELQNIEKRLALYLAIQKGQVPGIFPSSVNVTSSTWLSLYEKDRLQKNNEVNKNHQKYLTTVKEFKAFQKVILIYISAVSTWTTGGSIEKQQQKQTDLDLAIQNFQRLLTENYSAYKNLFPKIKLELQYNQLNPFHFAWLCYLLGLLLLFVGYLFVYQIDIRGFGKFWIIVSIFILLSGFCLHTYGMILRSMIMSRPPVTNMYETVIWVPWAAMILGAIIWAFQRFVFVLIGAIIASLGCLMLADMTPHSLLDGHLEPLEAVLNSNFWLSTHVLIITMSYGAFLLAFLLGNMCLYLFIKKEIKRKLINQYVKAIDRSIQVGVVLLALGTILGGIWADYSWGRFWGWDPKETWALISLLAYLALLHSRLMGWVREFGMVVGSILIFFLIVMAWYGVNYVLGQGLHSYGFGSGGVEYVLGFMLLHLIYVLWVWTWRKRVT